MRVDEVNLKDWISDIRNSEVALPRFQRYEEWERQITEKFLTSIVRDLPTGATLILEVRGEPPFEYRYLEGAPQDDNREPDMLLLDGQQRLTAVWKSLNNLYDNRTYLLDLTYLLDQEDGQPSVVSRKRYKKSGKEGLYPLWVDDPKKCLKRKKVPIYLLNPDDSPREMRKWCKEAVSDGEESDDILDELHDIRDRISRFILPRLCLEKDTDPNNAIDVFIKLNTSFVKLSTFDIVVARTEAYTGKSLHKKLEKLKEECPDIEDYGNPENYVLNVVTLLQGIRPTRKNKEERLDFQRLISEWDEVVFGTNELISFLGQERIFDNKRIPTNVVLAPLAALLTEMPSHPDERGNVKRLLKKYMWRAFFTDRYEATTNTRVHEDYKALKKKIKAQEVDVPCFDKNEHPLPTEEDLKRASWPTKKDRLGRAILSLTFKAGARNFADDDEISKRNISNREYHHLYPKDFLERQKIDEEEINKALNCALIRWEDNRTISGKDPLEYLLERSKADDLGEEQIRKRLKSHVVDYDAMTCNDYETFLNKRASDLAARIKRLCSGRDI